MLSNRQTTALRAFGKIESYKNDLNMLGSTLDGLSLWMPATALNKQCDQAIRMINDIGERFDRSMPWSVLMTCLHPGTSGPPPAMLLFSAVTRRMPISWWPASAANPWRSGQVRLPQSWSTCC